MLQEQIVSHQASSQDLTLASKQNPTFILERMLFWEDICLKQKESCASWT